MIDLSEHAAGLQCLKWAVTVVAVGYGIYATFALRQRSHINKKIKKDCAKVADTIEIEDIGEKVALCRCWKSEKFPHCDGSHNKHNECTGDNVGPVIVKKRLTN